MESRAVQADAETLLPVNAVMFDLDGTLLDTIADLAAAVNRMLAHLGRSPLPVQTVRTFVGKGIKVLVERALAATSEHNDDGLLDRILPFYEDCYAAVNGEQTTIYPGVIEGLNAFRAAGLPLACVTNKSERFTLPLLERTGLASYFSLVVAGDTLPKKKPDPLPLLHACDKFGIVPARMLMIGDSANDAVAARAAGCPVFCVPYGYSEGRNVRELDVDAIVPTLAAAARLVQKAPS